MFGLNKWFNGNKEQPLDDTLKEGQVWKYHTRPGEENSTLTILKVEKYDSLGVVVHVFINGVKIKNAMNPNGFTEEIGHMPISKDAVVRSITTLVKENSQLPPFEEGYNTWKKAFDDKKAGIFTIDVSETVRFLEEAMANARKVDE